MASVLRLTILLGAAAVFIPLISSAPVGSEFQALSYLTKFGYIDGKNGGAAGNLITQTTLTEAIKDFQRFAGIDETGKLDNETVTLMHTPRCGVKDKVGPGNQARRKRYSLQGSRWRSTDLTYKISKFPSVKKFSKSDVEQEIKKAFKVWSDQTQLSFTQKGRGQVNIDVRFERGEHGDGDPFDGVGGTLAHAYFPIYGGDAHFDDDERWTMNSIYGTNMLQVAAHEFGHSLGLSHSDVKSALMAPFYQGYRSPLKLHEDDIKAIQALYGKKKAEGPNKIPPSGKPSDGGAEEGELCSNSQIDTVFTAQSHTYAFKGKYYWEVIDDGLAEGYPRLVENNWRGLPTSIDAAFTWSNGKTYFFKDSQYWRYTGRSKDSGYPKAIKEGFTGIPDNVDAAFVWSGNDKIYFFKGSQYWKFDPDRKPAVNYDYPKDISTWKGIPADIDAAFQWTNHYTYFFKGTKYWRFNDRKFEVDKVNPPFPRSSAHWWFGCKAMSADNEEPSVNSLIKDSDPRLDVDDNSEDVDQHQPDPMQNALVNDNDSSSGVEIQSTVQMIVVGLFAQLVLL